MYVNYGLPPDYEALDAAGIDVKGKIVIARYGASWRGIKPKVAAEHGAVGCLIYSDPKDDGYAEGETFPNGPYRPKDGVQRGSGAATRSAAPAGTVGRTHNRGKSYAQPRRGRLEGVAQLAVARQLRRMDADVLHLRRLQAALLDDLELLVARIDDGVGVPGVDDREDRHVTIAEDEAYVLVRDLAERAQPLHALGGQRHPLQLHLAFQAAGERVLLRRDVAVRPGAVDYE